MFYVCIGAFNTNGTIYALEISEASKMEQANITVLFLQNDNSPVGILF